MRTLYLAFALRRRTLGQVESQGVECPRCQRPTRVLESRRAEDGTALRRRRECSACGHRFTTFERRAPEPLHVRKRDDTRQRFDRTKLRAALLRSTHKRQVEASEVESLLARRPARHRRSLGPRPGRHHARGAARREHQRDRCGACAHRLGHRAHRATRTRPLDDPRPGWCRGSCVRGTHRDPTPRASAR